MGYVLSNDGFEQVIQSLGQKYRLFAPVRKKGAGRFTDIDVILYDEVKHADEIELSAKSDYSFKEFLTPLSETLFFFTENQCRETELNEQPVLIFLRSCDLHALRRLDQIYLENGPEKDWFYMRRRGLVSFALIGCTESFENCFCASMGTNRTEDGYIFSVEPDEDGVRCSLSEPSADAGETSLDTLFAENALREAEVSPSFVTENKVKVDIPDKVPASILKDPL